MRIVPQLYIFLQGLTESDPRIEGSSARIAGQTCRALTPPVQGKEVCDRQPKQQNPLTRLDQKVLSAQAGQRRPLQDLLVEKTVERPVFEEPQGLVLNLGFPY